MKEPNPEPTDALLEKSQYNDSGFIGLTNPQLNPRSNLILITQVSLKKMDDGGPGTERASQSVSFSQPSLPHALDSDTTRISTATRSEDPTLRTALNPSPIRKFLTSV